MHIHAYMKKGSLNSKLIFNEGMEVFNERDDTFYECAGWDYGPLAPTVFAETSFRIKNREGRFTPLGSSTGVQSQF